MCYHFFAAFHTNLLCAFAQKKAITFSGDRVFLREHSCASHAKGDYLQTHTKKAITFSGDRVFLRKHTHKKAITFSGNRVFLRKHTQKKAITFSGDRVFLRELSCASHAKGDYLQTHKKKRLPSQATASNLQ